MAEFNLHIQCEPVNYSDWSADLDDQYRKFVADVTHLLDDDEVCGDLLGFDDGTIKALPANLDHHRCSFTGVATPEGNPPHAYNIAKSLLMSNAPGHCAIVEIDDESVIQIVYVPLCPTITFSCSPYEISPYEFYGGGYDANSCTPYLSTPSSTLTDASSLPTGTPPPVVQLYPPSVYLEPADGLQYTPDLVGNELYQEVCADSFEGKTVSPKDLMQDCQEPAELVCDYVPLNEHDLIPASPATTVVPLPQNIQPQLMDWFAPPQNPTSSYTPPPSRLERSYPTRPSTPLAQLQVPYSDSPALEPPSVRSRLRSGHRAPDVTTANARSNSTPNLRETIPLPPHSNSDVGIYLEAPHSHSSPREPVPTRPSLSPKKRYRDIPEPASDNDDDDDAYCVLSDTPTRHAGGRKRRKASGRGANHRFFCSWPGCRVGFTRFYDRTRHEAKHNGGGKEVCRVCGEELSRKDSLNRHMAKKHKDMGLDVDSDQDGR